MVEKIFDPNKIIDEKRRMDIAWSGVAQLYHNMTDGGFSEDAAARIIAYYLYILANSAKEAKGESK